jgi:excinuclease UvrABC nuclease subunit
MSLAAIEKKINVLTSEMHQAAAAEDFETAARCATRSLP